MSYTERTPLIIPANNKGDADAVFAVLDPDVGGAASFGVPLNTTGTGTATHWGSYTQLQTAAHAALTGTNQGLKTFLDARGRGLTPSGTITSFKQTIKIGAPGSSFWDFVAAQGLQHAPAVAAMAKK